PCRTRAEPHGRARALNTRVRARITSTPIALGAARGGHCMTTTSNRELPATEALIVSLDEYIRARYGLLAVQTFEEERFIRFMRGVAEHERHRAKGLELWFRTGGLSFVAGRGVSAETRRV